MKKNDTITELKPCCEFCVPFIYDTCIFKHTIKVTVCCVHCGKKVSGRTFEKAVKKWNRRVGNG